MINGSTGITTYDFGGFPGANGLAYDPGNGNVYIATYSGQELMAVVNGSTGRLVGTVAWPGSNSTTWNWNTQEQIAVDVTNGLAFLTGDDSNYILMVNTATDLVVGRLGVGLDPEGIVFDERNQCLYIANHGSDNITVINVSTNHSVASINLGMVPTSVAVDTRSNHLFVSDSLSGKISVIDGQTNLLLGNLSVGADPVGLAMDDSQGKLYVANQGSENVSVVNSSDNRIMSSIELMPQPQGAVLDTWTGNLYVTDFRSNRVLVVSGSTNRIITSVEVGSEPLGITFDTWNGLLYVANDGSGNVSVVNASSNQIVSSIGVGADPYGVAFDPQDGFVCVTNELSNNLTVINGTTNRVERSVAVGNGPMGLTYDGASGLFFVANYLSNSVSVVDPRLGANRQLLVGSGPEGIAFESSNSWLYVTDSGSSNITIINSSSGQAIGSVALPAPAAITYDSGNGLVYVASDSFGTIDIINGSNGKLLGQFGVGSAPVAVSYDPSTGLLYVANMQSGTLSIISDGIFRIPVAFKESGLPSNQIWSINFQAQTSISSAPVIVFAEPNGTYSYRLGIVPGWTTSKFTGQELVGGIPVDQNIVWARVEYQAQFVEVGLPNATNWSVAVGGAKFFSTTNTILSLQPNGSETFTLGGVPGWTTSRFSGTIQINGRPSSETFAWTETLYMVTFRGSGLAHGSWWITVGGTRTVASTNSLSLEEPNGTFAFQVGTSDTTYAAPAGSFVVKGAPALEFIDFSRVYYDVTFVARGLPAGTAWSVLFNGLARTGTTDLTFSGVPNGTYSFAVAGMLGYAASPMNGNLVVNGQTSEVIVIRAISNESGNGPHSPGFAGLTPIEATLVFAGVAAGFTGGGSIAILRYRRRRFRRRRLKPS